MHESRLMSGRQKLLDPLNLPFWGAETTNL